MNSIYCRVHFSACLLVLPLLLGCGKGGVVTYPVRGDVVFPDGTPVKFGSVEFYHPEHDLTSRGVIQPDGSFVLGTYSTDDGAPAGLHHVVITQLIMSGEAGITPQDHGRHVDDKFSRYESSGIEFEVREVRDNECPIVLESNSS